VVQQSARKKNFKKGIDQDEARRRRTETTIQIRKNKKEDRLNQRRRTVIDYICCINIVALMIFFLKKALESAESVAPSSGPAAPGPTISPVVIAEHTKNVFCNDSALQYKATQQFRRLLSIERQPPIQQVIEAGVVPRFVEFLQCDSNPPLQFEAAWALTNIASGTSDHTRVVIEAGAVGIFVQLLMSPNEDVREQAAWALGNIAGDSVMCRDLVLELGALPELLKLASTFGEESRLSTIRNTTWTLSNLCRGKPPPPFEAVRPALPLLARLLFSNDMETVTDACWALSYMSDGTNDRIQCVLNSGVAPRLVELLGSSTPAVQTPALRTVGNIVTGDDKQTQFVINLSALPPLLWLLEHPKKNIRKEACWTISNITAGTAEQIQAVIDADVFPKLIELLMNAEFDIQKEAAWAVSNATSGGTPQQIIYIVQQGAIGPLCNLLDVKDTKIVTVALEGIENILKTGLQLAQGNAANNPLAQVVAEHNGVGRIEELQNHEHHNIYQRAVKIIETYFGGEEEDEGEIAPEVVSGNGGAQFGFGKPTGGGPAGGVFNFGGQR
jgi:importin subunit alpha-6/7